MAKYEVIKRYGHERGLTTTFRQWRAPETHCSQLHGYSLAFEFCFEGDELDHRNWLIPFGDLKKLQNYLFDNFDHTVLVAHDDPLLSSFFDAEQAGMLRMIVVRHVGVEKFAEMVADWVMQNILNSEDLRRRNVRLKYVQINEHDSNAARFNPEYDEYRYAPDVDGQADEPEQEVDPEPEYPSTGLNPWTVACFDSWYDPRDFRTPPASNSKYVKR